MNKTLAYLSAAGLLLAGAGCSTYKEKPITADSVNAALAPKPIESVKVDASAIKHPLIKPIVIDGRDGFTPDELSVMVVISSPALRALRDQRGVSEAQVVQAGILPNPQLGYSEDRPSGNDDPTLVAAKSLGLSWDVTSLLTYHDSVKAAKSTAQSLDLSIAWQEWQAAQDARLRAYRIVSLEARIPLARSIEEGLGQTLLQIRKGVAAGAQVLTDETTASETFTTAQNARFDLEQQLSQERAALNLSLGLPPTEVVKIKAPVGLPVLTADAATAEGLLAGMEDRRLDLVALKFGYQSQEATLHEAVLAQFPKIGISGNRAQDTTPVKTNGFGITVDIPLFDRNQGQIAIAKATRQQLFDEYVQRVAEARSQVGQLISQLAVLQTQIGVVTDSLPQMQSTADAYDTALKLRRVDAAAAEDAKATVATRQMELSQLRQQALEIGVALEIASGRALLNQDPNS